MTWLAIYWLSSDLPVFSGDKKIDNMINGQTRIAAIQKLHHQHHDEKCELQNLNDNFGRYIQRVKDLENKNRELRSQIDALKQNSGKLLDNSFSH